MPVSLDLITAQSLNPTIVQAIKLIGMPQAEFEQYVYASVRDNPFFDTDSFEYLPRKNLGGYPAYSATEVIEDTAEAYDEKDTLYFDIKTQLFTRPESDRVKKNALLLAGYLDERAYIGADDFADFCALYGKTAGESALRLLQSLSPCGIAARDLGECICIQLRAMPENTLLAEKIALGFLPQLAKKQYKKIAESLQVQTQDVEKAAAVIRRTNPRPASAYNTSFRPHYVEPDFIFNESGELTMNRRLSSSLKINYDYADSIAGSCDAQAGEYLKERLKAAEELMNSIELRNRTVYACAAEIVRFQHDFFAEPNERKIKALTRRRIAHRLNLSESTVCRAVKDKYIQTKEEVYPLSYFFAKAVDNTADDAFSSYTAKRVIRELIAGEDKKSPLSDEKIVQLLKAQGVSLSRRAINKYRQQMNIPSSYERKC